MNKIDFNDLVTMLKKEKIKYIPNSGNMGDSLIAYGAYRLLEDNNIVDNKNFDTIVYSTLR